MNGGTYETPPPSVASKMGSRLSFVAASLFLALLIVLHVLKPEFDPSWRMISEYEIGRHGWIMQGGFLLWAASCVALFVAMWSQVGTRGGRIGLAFLLVTALGLVLAALGVSDPITAAKDQMTGHGHLHGLGAMLGIPSLPIAAVLITLSLRRNQAWLASRRSLLWTAHLTWVCMLMMDAIMIILLHQNGGKFGPSVAIGWPNRLLVVAYCAWMMLVAWRASRLPINQQNDN
jgi:hypothetical protein